MAPLFCTLLPLLSLLALRAAAVRLPQFVGSSMVVQRDVPIPLQGFDGPGAHVLVKFLGISYTTTADDSGRWSVTLPAQSGHAAPASITITSDQSPPVTLDDVAFGDVVVCSGQSNMELGVIATVNQSQTIADAARYAPSIRLLQVATLNEYYNVSAPQDDLNVSVAWTRVNANALPYFSAMCYWYAVSLLAAQPALVLGLVDSSWGGTAIEPWMDPASLHACGEQRMRNASLFSPPLSSIPPASAHAANLDPGLPRMRAAKGGHGAADGPPSLPSTLFNSMIAPLLHTPVSAVLWYQGESNAGNPEAYARCFPAFIQGWRAQWSAGTQGATDPQLPFVFVQLASWPALDNGLIATQRYAQQAALALPKVAMVVAADIGDPASPFHPIHPPWKAEVGRRASLAAAHMLYGQTDVPLSGPRVVAVHVDGWQQSWGDYHLGFGSGVCGPGSGFLCVGVRVVFDQPLAVDPTFGLAQGFPSGFELLSASAAQFMPAVLTGLRDDVTLQLNATWVFGDVHAPPAVLRYAWHDYPTMLVANSFGQPAPPFNVSLPAPGRSARV